MSFIGSCQKRIGFLASTLLLLLTPPGPEAQASGVLWVGAHPDDEVYVAPVLADLCLRQGMKCNFIVLTDGGKGHCLLPGGCQPSTASVRAGEMARSAAYFHAGLSMANLEDSPAGSPDGVISAWNDSVGGGTVLVDALTSYLKTMAPDVILTFDPRHGSSCHLDHRAVGRLVLGAAIRAGISFDSIYFPEAYWKTGLASPTQAWAGNATIISSDTAVHGFDATAVWSSIPDVLTIHRSQFSPAKNDYLDAFRFTPAEFRIQPLLKAADTDMADPRYRDLCPYNDAQWPIHQ